MLVRYLQVFIISILYCQIIQCDLGYNNKGPSRWFVEWTFIDTLNSIDPIFYIIEVRSDNNNSNSDIEGYLLSNCVIFDYFDTEHKSLIPQENLTVRMQLFDIDSSVVYDSVFSWEQMDFKEQYSEVEDKIFNYLSKKTIYLDTMRFEL